MTHTDDSNTYILGISCYYHDASATLLKNGRISAAAAEERFSRQKHDKTYPRQAIDFCLNKANISGEDLDGIAFYEKPFLKFERILTQHLHAFPTSFKTFLKTMPSWLTTKLRVRNTINDHLDTSHDIAFIKHHKSHAASAYHTAPFDDTAILTVDGVGEWTTTAYGTGTNGEITIEAEQQFPHSIGLLYSTITALLGFRVNNSEYKVMGLAAHGTMNRADNPYYDKLKATIIQRHGAVTLNQTYFDFTNQTTMYTENLQHHLDNPPQQTEQPTQHQQDIAAALQLLTEDLLTNLMHHVHDQTGKTNLVYAGGVALNSAFNGKITDKTPFDNIWIQPAASDCGGSLGAATQLHSLEAETQPKTMQNALHGPAYTDTAIQNLLDDNNVPYDHLLDDKLQQRISQLIATNHVIAIFRDRMEWGPRALGNRSILANPCDPTARDNLNTQVKHREPFRPFAPAVQKNKASTYFDIPDNPVLTDYMLAVHDVKDEWQDSLPSITHTDGTARLQTVDNTTHPWFHDLLDHVNEQIGVPIVINTSFNLSGEPIVASPSDAIKTVRQSDIDILILQNQLVKGDTL